MERVLNGRYRIIDKIGDGGMAVVYLAVDLLLDRQVAVKVLRDQYAADERFLTRFRREAKAAANLSHPNIVSIFDVGQDGDCHYIVMERIEGVSLKDILVREGPLSPARTVRIATQVCGALNYAHGKGLVHRDIKPQNILMAQGEQVKVVDFGIAKGLTDASLTEAGIALGTVQYLSPEQARGEQSSHLSDIYSLGVIVYEMATGHLPFESDTAVGVALKHIDAAPPPPRDFNPSVPETLEAIILRAMSKDPAARFSSAAEFAEALSDYQHFGQDRTTVVTAHSTPAKAPPRARPASPKDGPARRAIEERVKPVPAGGKRVATSVQRRDGGVGCGGIAVMLLIIGFLAALIPFLLWVLPALSDGRSLLGSVDWNWGGGTSSATPTATVAPSATASPTSTSTAVILVRVPRLVDQQLEAAKSQVTQLGLKVLVGSTQYSDTVEEGVILDQSIREGDEVEQGTVIEVSVSMGKKTVNIPPLANVAERDATDSLDQLNVAYVVQHEASATVPEGVVIRQSHLGQVPLGTRVTLVVSMGDKVQVPDMFGYAEAEAQNMLKAAGLRTAEPNYQTQKDMPPGVSIKIVAPGHVLSATPDFNTWVDRGTVVYLAVRQPD